MYVLVCVHLCRLHCQEYDRTQNVEKVIVGVERQVVSVDRKTRSLSIRCRARDRMSDGRTSPVWYTGQRETLGGQSQLTWLHIDWGEAMNNTRAKHDGLELHASPDLRSMNQTEVVWHHHHCDCGNIANSHIHVNIVNCLFVQYYCQVWITTLLRDTKSYSKDVVW